MNSQNDQIMNLRLSSDVELKIKPEDQKTNKRASWVARRCGPNVSSSSMSTNNRQISSLLLLRYFFQTKIKKRMSKKKVNKNRHRKCI